MIALSSGNLVSSSYSTAAASDFNCALYTVGRITLIYSLNSAAVML